MKAFSLVICINAIGIVASAASVELVCRRVDGTGGYVQSEIGSIVIEDVSEPMKEYVGPKQAKIYLDGVSELAFGSVVEHPSLFEKNGKILDLTRAESPSEVSDESWSSTMIQWKNSLAKGDTLRVIKRYKDSEKVTFHICNIE